MGVVTSGLDFFNVDMPTLEKVLMIIPSYALISSIISVGKINGNRIRCKIACEKNVTCLTQNDGWTCEQAPEMCCDTFDSHFTLNSPGLGFNIISLIVVSVLAFSLLLMIDFEVVKQWISKLIEINKNYYEVLLEKGEPDGVDEDVMKEKIQVRGMGKDEMKDYQLVTKDLSKCYGKLVAVNQLCVSIDK